MRGDGDLFNIRVFTEEFFNLLELDPIATDFNLVICPAEELDRTVGPKTGEIPSAIEARVWVSDKRAF